MTDFEFMVQDRITKIRSINELYNKESKKVSKGNNLACFTLFVLSRFTLPIRTPTRGALTVKGGERGPASAVWVFGGNFCVAGWFSGVGRGKA